MLVDAKVSVVITEDGALAGWEGSDVTVVDVESMKAELAAQPADDPETSLDGSNLAYVIFTSGSTGRPKGVEVQHASLSAAATAWADVYTLRGHPMPHLQAAPFGFDVFTGNLARALCTGGSLVACSRETLLDAPALVNLMRREHVGCAEVVPVVATVLADELERTGGGLPDLRLLAVGSDTLRLDLYGRLRRLLGPTCRVANSYGLTEATIDSSVFEESCTKWDDRPVPIGRPLPGTRVYILDREMRVSPPGVAGELYVGGTGVARGYASDPRRTASRFVPDPFGDSGGRLYRTGDVARWGPGGAVELLGRLDGQVKVRGHRVELGEIEVALLQHEAVHEAAVVANDNDADGVQLVAYIAGHPGRPISAESVRRSLRERLPRPMIPSRIVALEALPRTPAGKVDRDALPTPPTSLDNASIPPRDEVERRLVTIWEELLGVRPIGATDDFFDLGGHSLLAVRLAARIEEEFGNPLPLSTLFLATTVEALADRLRAPVEEPGRSVLVEFGTSAQVASLAMVHPVGGGVLCYRALARSLEGMVGVLGFQADGIDGDAVPDDNLPRMAARYVEALLEARPSGPYFLGGWSLGGVIAFEMARQLEARGYEVSLLALIDSSAPGPARAPGLLDAFGSMAAFADDLARTSSRDGDRSIERRRNGEPPAIEADGFDPSILPPELLAEVGPDRLRRHYEVFRANRRAVAAYEPAPYQGRAVLIQAETSWDSTPSWRGLIRGGVTTHTLPGDHYTILQKPTVTELAAILARECGASRRISQ
jgi:amino acid adenylation domain-containing protein